VQDVVIGGTLTVETPTVFTNDITISNLPTYSLLVTYGNREMAASLFSIAQASNVITSAELTNAINSSIVTNGRCFLPQTGRCSLHRTSSSQPRTQQFCQRRTSWYLRQCCVLSASNIIVAATTDLRSEPMPRFTGRRPSPQLHHADCST